MNKIRIQVWDEKKFANSRQDWSRLLESSQSDQLFLSWEWQYTWWKVFAIAEKMQLRLYAAIDENNTLVGIAPLYLSSTQTAKYLHTRRLQFIGNCWRTRDTMRTELLEFIVATNRSADVIAAFFEHIHASNEWDEFILVNINKASQTYQLLTNKPCLPGCYLRKAEEYVSYFLKTHGQFKHYLDGLGKNSRLRVFNRRKILEALGKVTFRAHHGYKIDELFELLNQLHRMRWGHTAFSGDRLEFNKTVAKLFSEKDGLHFSIIAVDFMPVSIQYNYSINCHTYNIQAGFNPSFHKKLPLGYLHFGYEIEQAFNNDITVYDFLAGEGKNTSYKENLTKDKYYIVDLQVVRKRSLQILYRIYGYLRKIKLVS